MRVGTALGLAWLLPVLAASACGSTEDTLGYNRLTGADIQRVSGPAAYPNAFRDLLGETEADIDSKIAAAFAQLFHGDPNTQAIYFTVGADQAYVVDVLHNDIRTEGVGLGMLISVELDKRDEFDRLWTFAKTTLEVASGPDQGYFDSWCDSSTSSSPCFDPFGMQQFVTALVFANDSWGSASGAIDYASDAAALFNVMRHKQDENGGVVDDVTDVFDAGTHLVLALPVTSAAGQTRPAVEMPGYYDLWAQATGDPFWTRAAASARASWRAAANAATGLLPVRASFTGAAVPGWDTFQPEGYRAQLEMVIDDAWSGTDAWEATEADRLLAFFTAQGIDQYCARYTLDGATCLDPAHDASLVSVNGATASIATASTRSSFVTEVWNQTILTGPARYYAGILYLVSLLLLSGQLQVL